MILTGVALSAVLAVIFSQQCSTQRVGGWSEERRPVIGDSESDSLNRVLASTIRDQYQRQTGTNPSAFDLVSYQTQVVAGTNYNMKVRVNAATNEYAQLTVYHALPYMLQRGEQEWQLMNIQRAANAPSNNQVNTITGGWGQQNTGGDSELRQALAGPIRDQYQRQTGSNPPAFELVSYQTQVVAGTNYNIKILTNAATNEYVDLLVYRALPNNVQRGEQEWQLRQVQKSAGSPNNNLPQRGGTIDMQPIAGGWGQQQNSDADSELKRALAGTIRDQYQRQTGTNPPAFELVSYQTQVVAGTNYNVKVLTNAATNEYAQLVVYRALPYMVQRGDQEWQLTQIQGTNTNGPSNNYLQNAGNGYIQPMLGGMSQVKQPNSIEGQMLQTVLTRQIRPQYVSMTGTQPQRFALLSYSSQVVAGTNYLMKVAVNGQSNSPTECTHLKVFMDPSRTKVQLVSVQRPNTCQDPLTSF